MRIIFLCVVLFLFGHAAAQNQITIGDKGKDTINRNIYGHFAEHLGRCIYGGFYVGENNKAIPNKDGIRTDIVEALKKFQAKNNEL